jgi:hypothetical protein
MNFLTRCCTKQSKEIDHQQKHLYNEHHFSSGMDLPVHPKIIYPSTVLDKELTIGQFGEPQKMQRLVKTLNS